ncbi:MAG TPA: type II toxin-antitoxin system death-on-curing family toxin [Verrucomicrobiae bacterium]|nr:type II toxin-antitoxin system death-on-curing family toxin [Verrucomicrobiae bacterium]
MEPRFLTLDEVLYVHEESLRRYGGMSGVGDVGLIQSALGSAQNAFWYGHGDLYAIAATYAFHIAEAQAFNDGNKRTGAGSAIMFLLVNGIRFPGDDGSVYTALIDVAEKKLDKPGLAGVLRKLAEKNIKP